MSVFQSTDYKELIKSRLHELKAQNPHYNFQNLAKECGVQKTYLSKVLNGDEADLNSDQLFLAVGYLGFAPEEKRYVTILHQWQRAYVPLRKTHLENELTEIRRTNEKSEHHVPAPPVEVSSPTLVDYYLDPDSQLTHMFLSIERFANKHEIIRQKLDLSKERFSQILKRLLQLKVVVLKKGNYLVERGHMHLPWDSSLIVPYRTLLRLRGIERVNKAGKRAYSYSVIFTASPKEREIIQKEFVEFLKRFDPIVRKAPSKEVYQMNFDLFDWSL